MRNLSKNFENKNIDYEKLLEYGFDNIDNNYSFENMIYDNRFKVIIEISKRRQTSKIIDLSTNEEYVLVDEESTFFRNCNLVVTLTII